MKVCSFTYVDLYRKGLVTLEHLLDKGAEHAQLHNIPDADMLEWRLAADMFPLSRQAQIVINFARQWPARVAGLEVPDPLEGVTSLSDLRAAIHETCAFLVGLDATQFEERDGEPLRLDLGSVTPTLPLGQWLSGFATTNFYFHLTTAYGILRSRGVPLAKPDLFAGGL